MKLLQAFVVAGILAGTACQRIPPKPENVSVAPELPANTATRAGGDSPAAPQLDPSARRLKEQLGLTGQQTQELDKSFKEIRAKQKVLMKELRDLSNKRQERIKAVLTQEQLKKYEQERTEVPEHPGQPEP